MEKNKETQETKNEALKIINSTTNEIKKIPTFIKGLDKKKQALREIAKRLSEIKVDGPNDKKGYKELEKGISIARTERTSLKKERDHHNSFLINARTVLDENIAQCNAIINPVEDKLKERKEEIDKEILKIKEDEAKRKHEIYLSRCQDVLSFSPIFNGFIYVLEKYDKTEKATVDNTELNTMTDEEFEEKLTLFSTIHGQNEAKKNEDKLIIDSRRELLNEVKEVAPKIDDSELLSMDQECFENFLNPLLKQFQEHQKEKERKALEDKKEQERKAKEEKEMADKFKELERLKKLEQQKISHRITMLKPFVESVTNFDDKIKSLNDIEFKSFIDELKLNIQQAKEQEEKEAQKKLEQERAANEKRQKELAPFKKQAITKFYNPIFECIHESIFETGNKEVDIISNQLYDNLIKQLYHFQDQIQKL